MACCSNRRSSTSSTTQRSTRRSAPTVSVRAWRQEGDIVIEVSDEGPGIPLDDLERVFDKFYRSPMADRKRAGTGLGLAMSRGFVEAMGGRLAAGNRTERSGAVFTMIFPRRM